MVVEGGGTVVGAGLFNGVVVGGVVVGRTLRWSAGRHTCRGATVATSPVQCQDDSGCCRQEDERTGNRHHHPDNSSRPSAGGGLRGFSGTLRPAVYCTRCRRRRPRWALLHGRARKGGFLGSCPAFSFAGGMTCHGQLGTTSSTETFPTFKPRSTRRAVVELRLHNVAHAPSSMMGRGGAPSPQ